MATSESDGFESADDELVHDNTPTQRSFQAQQWSSPSAIDSESDDDTEFVPRTPYANRQTHAGKSTVFSSGRAAAKPGGTASAPVDDTIGPKNDGMNRNLKGEEFVQLVEKAALSQEKDESQNKPALAVADTEQLKVDEASPKVDVKQDDQGGNLKSDKEDSLSKPILDNEPCVSQPKPQRRERAAHQPRKPGGPRQLGAKKLGMRLGQSCSDKAESEKMPEVENQNTASASKKDPTIRSESSDKKKESDMPEELRSDKKFKDIFKPQGWEDIGDDVDLPEDLTEDKLQPVLERLSLAAEQEYDNSSGWGSWGSWGVSSLINTATAGVSTLTSHMSHQLTLLEESMGVPDPKELANEKHIEEMAENSDKPQEQQESVQSLTAFGFGNFMSGVSSITKLVESTGTKVMAGGLGTLEALGKKTMEVLQDGDPGLKKKRAFFLNEGDKPNLSQILREAKEKAESAEKSIEEKQKARKVHFESLFDDYQGLVHLEALEMLSKQSNMRIQQHLASMDGNELISIQETLEEVKELCDLGDDDEDNNDFDAKDLKVKLQEACADLGVNISYTEKLYDNWEECQKYLASSDTHSDQEILETALLTLAQFTAYCLERFHKTAELLLIKERRSTVNEADALVQLTHILTHQTGTLANCFVRTLNQLAETVDNRDNVYGHITTIYMEAANASSYIQDAFALLIPILQVGAL